MRRVLGLSAECVRVSARLLLLALSVTTLGPVMHGVHDTELHAFVVLHDETKHHFQDASSPESPLEADHCVACHFVRTSRGPVSWEPSGLVAFTPGNLCVHADGNLVASEFADPRPARAPPLV